MFAKEFSRQNSGFSNCYKLVCDKSQVVYRYDLNILLGKTPTAGGNQTDYKSFTDCDAKRTYGYHEEAIAYSLLSSAHSITNGFGISTNAIQMVYDNRTILFTNIPIRDKYFETVLSKGEYGKYADDALHNPSVKVVLKFNSDLHFNNMEYYNPNIGNENRSLLQFLELLTTQPLIDSTRFIKTLRGDVFCTSPAYNVLPTGLVMLKGMTKGVSLMKENADVKFCVTVDGVIAPFFQHGPLFKLLEPLLKKRLDQLNDTDYNRFLSVYKNVKVVPNYNRVKCYVLQHLSKAGANDTFISYMDNKISVQQYYQQRYGIKLLHPNLRMLEKESRHFTVFIPLELLDVLPGQRVPMTKFDVIGNGFGTNVTRTNLMNPQNRSEMIREAVTEIQSGHLFEHFGVHLDLVSNKVEIGIRNTPTITNGNMLKNGSWRTNKYDKAVTINHWVVLYGSGANIGDAHLFVKKMKADAAKKNVILAEVADILQFNSGSTNVNYWNDQFLNIKEMNLDILFLIDSNKTTTSHNLLKLCEREHQVLTQQVTVEAIKRLSSFENILNKTNEKLGGLCHRIVPERMFPQFTLAKNKYLVFGYDVSHPKPSNRDDRMAANCLGLESLNPSVVGLSFNCGADPCNFIGDYFFQKAKKEQVDGGLLQQKVTIALKKWKANRRGIPLPDIVFIFRDGISDGQFAMALNEELPAFRNACASIGYHPKFVFIVATKRHRKRFFDKNFQNICISSVIEKGIGRTTVTGDWYMQSANPIIGTAKPPNFVLLKNEPIYSEDELQSFCAYLCYNHQINSGSISLPEPVQMSHELAKRGANNLEQYLRLNAMPRDIDGVADVQVLINLLSYETTRLSNQRFNA